MAPGFWILNSKYFYVSYNDSENKAKQKSEAIII